jgi:hypothetical protein
VKIVLKHGQDSPDESPGRSAGLRFDLRFVHEHDGDVVFHGINAMASSALQTLRILSVFEGLLVVGTDQNFEEIFGDHDASILRQRGPKCFHSAEIE